MEFNHFGKCLRLTLYLRLIYILIHAGVCGLISMETEFRQGQWRDTTVSVWTHLPINSFGADVIEV